MLISCAVTAELSCIFAFAYAKSRFSDDTACLSVSKSDFRMTKFKYLKELCLFQETIEELKKLTDHDEVTDLQKTSENNETSVGSTDVTQSETKAVTDKAIQDNLDDCITESSKADLEVSSGIKINTKDNDEIKPDCNLDSSMSNADMSAVKADVIESDSVKVGKSVDKDAEISSTKDCNGSMDAENLDNINLTSQAKIDPHTCDTKTVCEVMDTSEPTKNVKDKFDSVKKEAASEQNRPCVVCLGILEEFTSDEFLQKVHLNNY